MSSENTGVITERELQDLWLWLLKAVYGLTITFGFKTLAETLSEKDISPLLYLVQIWIAVCLFVFFLYYILVYHCLLKKFPYKKTKACTLRVMVDLGLAFTFFQALISGLKSVHIQNKFTILISICLWHFLVIIWYYLASRSHPELTTTDPEKPKKSPFRHHFGTIAFFAIVFFLFDFLLDFLFIPSGEVKKTVLSMVFSTSILLVAVYRTKTFVWELVIKEKSG